MPDPVVTRFAPSPTGSLHIGGARTALFNWLYARQQGGKFLIRIEDTDAQRNDEAHVNSILADLRWLGLNWDNENEPPVRQSKRLHLYNAAVDKLLREGRAYESYDTPEEIEARRKRRKEAGERYPDCDLPDYDIITLE